MDDFWDNIRKEDFMVECTFYANDPAEEDLIPIHILMPKGVQMELGDWDQTAWASVIEFIIGCVAAYKEETYGK